MERVFVRSSVGLLGVVVALMFTLAIAPQAFAASQDAARSSDLQAASVSTQASGGNTSKAQALLLTSGKTSSGHFDLKSEYGYKLYEYWYKFKTSSRKSVYSLTVTSPDQRSLYLYKYDKTNVYVDESPNKTSEAWTTLSGLGPYSVLDPNESYSDMLGKKEWLYFRIAPSNSSVEDDRFTIQITEHPIIEKVKGLKKTKATKKSLTVKWTKQANAGKYQVKYKAKGSKKWKTKTVKKKNAITLTKLKKNTKYQVKVRAYCADGWNEWNEITDWADWSATKTFKTKK